KGCNYPVHKKGNEIVFFILFTLFVSKKYYPYISLQFLVLNGRLKLVYCKHITTNHPWR
uniref:Uncharacterized protein n=1 Tax=Aegilops tauschii subsp. strangulata TaxID=200361 RepID=A0A453Q6A9_AEGTS